jgi:glycosyltransferase involved in cell wall biosynthesis
MRLAGDLRRRHRPGRDGRAPAGGRVVSALFFFPRGGSAEVTRSLSRALPAAGWRVKLAVGSLGQWGEPTHAASFFAGVDVRPLDYSPALERADRLAAAVPFPPSYEDRPDAPDRVFAAVDDAAHERLVAAWIEVLARAGADAADLLHLHHLTPVNEAAARRFPSVPVLGQLHGTELAMLRRIEAGAPPGWRYAQEWSRRLRTWARRCGLLVVPPGAEADAALLLGLERAKLRGLASGVELERFTRRPLAAGERLAFWRRWLVEQPRGWDPSGRPGSIAYRDEQLAPFRAADTVFVYVGRFTAVKRLPLLISAHARAVERLGKPAPLVLVGGHPGEWEGEHPLTTARRIGNRQVFLAGWRPHEQLPQALNAADALVLPSVAEAFGLVLVEAMACGLPVIACRTHGPAAIVADGKTGWRYRPTTRTHSSMPSSPPLPPRRSAARVADTRKQTAVATPGRRSPLATRPSTKICSPPHSGSRSQPSRSAQALPSWKQSEATPDIETGIVAS